MFGRGKTDAPFATRDVEPVCPGHHHYPPFSAFPHLSFPRDKIVVLDEASANIDAATDARVQSVLRDCFYAHTVVSIAHRLDTLSHSDRYV